MARRRNGGDAIGVAAQLLGLLVVSVYRIATRPKHSQVAIARSLGSRQSVSIPPVVFPPRGTVPLPSRLHRSPNAPKTPASTSEFIRQLNTIDWFQFEKIVGLVCRKLGYRVTPRGGANPDGGIDLLITRDGETKAVQCKQWKAWKVGVKPIREFLGALMDAGIQKGIFITMRGYTREAKELANKHGIEIVDEKDLAVMLDATDARFDPEALELLHDKHKYCPKCERPMELRTSKKGMGTGSQFWGCSAFPRCRFTLQTTS